MVLLVYSGKEGISLRFTPKGDKPLNQFDAQGLEGLNKLNKPLNQLSEQQREANRSKLKLTPKDKYIARRRRNLIRSYHGGRVPR